MTNLLRRVVTASVLSALVLSSAAPANASLKHRKHAAMARGHHAKLPVHHTKLPVRHALGASSIPTTPTNFVATAGDQQAAFSWTGTNGATRYVVMVRPNNASCVTVATVCAVRGLTNGTVYSATVVAVNNLGSSAPSVTRTVTPVASRPFAPRSVSAMAFGLHARVTWVLVTGLSNPVTSYTVTATPGGMTCQSATTTCVIAELTAGTTYTFTVTATNAVGTSSSSDPSNSVTITDLPSAPTNIVLTPAPQEIGVSWDASASNGGLSIDSYRATAYLASSGAPVAHCLATGATSCIIANLHTATSYVVRVLAHNAEGYSVASLRAGPVTTGFYAPGVPQAVVVTGGPASIQVAWNIPVSDGGGAITGYTVTADDGNGGVFACTTTTATNCTVTGLTNGTSYTVTVVATNGVGDSPSSAPQTGTPGDVPDAPTALQVTPGNGETTVSWTAPVIDGGTAVSLYTVTADDGNGGVFTCTTSSTTCTVVGLTNGVTYTFTVVATNLTGDSLASGSQTATPVTTPGAPTISTLTPGDGSITVDFTAPASTGGSAITGYTATADDGNSGVFTCNTTSSLSCTITGLTNGTAYLVTVIATTAVGDSNASASVGATPYTLPSTPFDVTATLSDGAIIVNWSDSLSNGGDEIFRYTATADDGNGGVFTCTSSTSTCTITGLKNGTLYSVTVVATNNAGDSTASSVVTVTPAAVASEPVNVTTQIGDSSISVAWDWPLSDGGSAVTSFLVTAVDINENVYTCLAGPGISSWWTACTITGLTNGTGYSITVVATNAAGDSAPSSAVIATPAVAPSAPLNVAISVDKGSLVISWDSAQSNGGAEITTYTVWMNGVVYCETTTLSCTVSSLSGSTNYDVTVTATNVVGNSPDSVGVSLLDGRVVQVLNISGYSAAEITGVLASVYGLNSIGAATVLRDYLGINSGDSVYWLNQGGYSLTDIATALHYVYSDSASGVWYEVCNTFTVNDVDMATVLHAAGYSIAEVGGFLHYYWNDSASAAALALNVSYNLTDVEMALALNNSGYDCSSIVRMMYDVYENSSDASAAALQSAFSMDAFTVTQYLNGSGSYNRAELTTTLRTYFGLTSTDAASILRNGLGINSSDSTLWLFDGGYTLSEIAIALNAAYGDGVVGAYYDLRNLSVTSDADITPLLYAANYSITDIGYLLHYYFGDSASTAATLLNVNFNLSDVDMAAAMNGSGYDGYSIVRMLFDVYGDSSDAAASVLQTAFTMDYYTVTQYLNGSGSYTRAQITTTLRTYFELSPVEAGNVLRFALGVNSADGTIWLYDGGYTLAEITLAMHYSYGEGVVEVWYNLRNWFPVTDVDMATLLHSGDYSITDIAYLLHFYLGESATMTATALAASYTLTDVEMAIALNGGSYDGYSIVRMLFDVYGDSSDAAAYVLQTAFAMKEYTVTAYVYGSGSYTRGSVTATLRTYYELSATDAGTILRYTLGVNSGDAPIWLFDGGYTMSEITTALRLAYGEGVAGAWSALHNWFYMPDTTITPLLFDGGYAVGDVGYLLHYYYGDNASTTGNLLLASYALSDVEMAAALNNAGYDGGRIAQMLYDVYGDAPNRAAYVLETSLSTNVYTIAAWMQQSNVYSPGDVVSALRTYFELSATDAASVIRFGIGINSDWAPSWLAPGGYTLTEVATALHYGYGVDVYGAWGSLRNWYTLTDAEIAVPLYGAGYSLSEIAYLLRAIYGDSATQAAAALNQLIPMTDVEMSTVLSNAGYYGAYIAAMLSEYYADDSSAAAHALATGLNADIYTVTVLLQQSNAYGAAGVTSALRNYYELDATDAANVIRSYIGINMDWMSYWLDAGGYSLVEIATALRLAYGVDAIGAWGSIKNWFTLNDTEITSLFAAAGFTAIEIGYMLHYIYADNASAAATALNLTYNFSDADMLNVLDGALYNYYEITYVLRTIYADSALTALNLVMDHYGLIQYYALDVLRNGGYNVSVPDSPGNFVITALSGELDFTWDVPTFDGSFDITGYTVTATDDANNTYTCTTTSTSCNITGLTNGTTYHVSIVATNLLGDSLSAGTIAATPCTTPGSP